MEEIQANIEAQREVERLQLIAAEQQLALTEAIQAAQQIEIDMQLELIRRLIEEAKGE